MARGVKCSVRVGKFEWRRAGYAELQNSAPVQAIVQRKANAVRASAESMLTDDHYRKPGFSVKRIKGTLANGRVVRTLTDHARYSQAKHKTLEKALGAAKGA